MKEQFLHCEEHLDQDMVKIEVNLDDITGEWLGYVMDKLFQAGANDVFYTPIYMKKNRPGIMLQLLCSQNKVDEMMNILFHETTTLGVRYYPLQVYRLSRNFIDIQTTWGKVTVKQGLYQGKVVQTAPEYESCRILAEKNDVPLKEIYLQVWEKISQLK
ncbi:nickel insertion protein [Alkalihalobacillus sp. BA299]|uniref:nickel insertion protein n=1 Tax=Alkalihalobacillus sp. BA299 TaxID=2815938 RepID=UPI001ADBFC01|nr:nickel insertion protein [Alkalihalobacillus sp. BA299]